MGAELSQNEAMLLALIEQAVALRLPAPSNRAIGDHLGVGGTFVPSRTLQSLAKKGVIHLDYPDHSNRHRRVTIVATGMSTAQIELGSERILGQNRPKGLNPVPPTPPVDRDPCFYCGVRRDVGCSHQLRGC